MKIEEEMGDAGRKEIVIVGEGNVKTGPGHELQDSDGVIVDVDRKLAARTRFLAYASKAAVLEALFRPSQG